jgi:carbonic anhydrase/acetyltransferase-like protein (isoleucine patch superfamily)
MASGLGGAGLLLILLGIVTGRWMLTALGLVLAAAGGLLFATSAESPLMAKLQTLVPQAQPGIGMGATVADGAVVEPGASVEMGASVGKGAVVESGAVVRMGASIGKGAVVKSGAVVRMGASVSRGATVESGAVVSWGATVGADSVVGEKAIVGAGADLRPGARLPPGTWLRPGASYGARSDPAVAARPAELPAPPDPRKHRVAAACDKLEAELRAAPSRVRAFLGGSGEVVASLRRTCDDLAARERALRAEAEPEALARLDEERAALQRRIEAEKDGQIRGSLQGAVAAIDEQKKQRDLLVLGAERLQAEHTRLVYTLEGLASQLVRMRTAGAGAAPDAELERSVAQIKLEIDAITDALDEVSRGGAQSFRELATGPADAAPTEADRSGVRSRD